MHVEQEQSECDGEYGEKDRAALRHGSLVLLNDAVEERDASVVPSMGPSPSRVSPPA